jgi:xanthine dehydrogenase accessory factor
VNSLDWEVLTRAAAWLQAGRRVHLFTVVQTWGSAPRLPGALLAVRDDGHLVGSVSGGCIEDDLADRARNGKLPTVPALLEYGVSRDEAQRYGIPCGGRLQICAEPLADAAMLQPLIEAMAARRMIRRSIRLGSSEVEFGAAAPGSAPAIENGWFHSHFGPQWRLLIIGANQLGSLLAQFAQTLDFAVLICDPRAEMRAEWQVSGVEWLDAMPDDAVLALKPDAHTAIVAVTHDPKLDDMALLEALKSPAFYIGALGSRANTAARKERLALFDLSAAEIDRLHGPIGLHLGSKTPAEIAVSILAEIVSVRHGVELVQKKDGSAVPPAESVCLRRA